MLSYWHHKEVERVVLAARKISRDTDACCSALEKQAREMQRLDQRIASLRQDVTRLIDQCADTTETRSWAAFDADIIWIEACAIRIRRQLDFHTNSPRLE
jgi:hypothetical protein